MFRIVICDDKKENIAFLNKSIRKGIYDIQQNSKTEILSARPEVLYNYSIKDDNVYIIILDTIYNSVSGIDIARRLRKQYKNVYFIFITEHFELESLVINHNIMPSGFLNKSVNETELRKSLVNIFDYCNEDKKMETTMLTINTGSAIYKIKYDEIIYIEALNKKIYIYTETQRISCYNSLQLLSKELRENFIRCHKSYIVNIKKIKNIYTRDMYIEMNNGSKIPMSRTYKASLKELLK